MATERELSIKLNLKDMVAKDLNRVIEELQGLNRAATKTNETLDDSTRSQKKFTDASLDAAKATVQFESKILTANTAFSRSAKSTMKAAEAIGDLNHMVSRADEIMARFEAQLDDVDKKASQNMFGKMIDGLQELGQQATKSMGTLKTKLSGLRDDMNQAGKFALGNMISDGFQSATQAAINFGKESITVALKYEGTMNSLARATGLGADELENLSGQLQGLATDIGPATAQNMAEVAEAAAKMGVGADKIKQADLAKQLGDTAKAAQLYGEAREEILGFTKVIGEASVAIPDYKGKSEELALAINKQISLFGTNSTMARQYLDVINYLDDQMNATTPQIIAFMNGFTGAKSLGFAQEEAAALGATLVSLGQEPHDAATRLQSAMDMLRDRVGKSGRGLSMIAERSPAFIDNMNKLAGTTLNAASTNDEFHDALLKALDKDVLGSIELVQTGLAGVESNVERSKISTLLYGAVGKRAMNALSGDFADLAEGSEGLATSILGTEANLKSLEQATGQTRGEFSTTADFIASALRDKPEAAVEVLIQSIQSIPDKTERTAQLVALFGAEMGKNLAEGGKSGLEQLVTAVDAAGVAMQKTGEKTGSIATEFAKALQTNQAKFDEFGGMLETIQLKIGTDLMNAIGDVVATDLTPLASQFTTWLTTSKEAETLFKTTIPGAIKLTVDAVAGLSGALSGINNMLVTAANFWGTKIDEMSARAEKSQAALATQFEPQSSAVNDDGTVNKQVAAAEQLRNSLQSAYDANAKLIEGNRELQTFYASVFTEASSAVFDATGVTDELKDSVASFKEELQLAEGNVSALDPPIQAVAKSGQEASATFKTLGESYLTVSDATKDASTGMNSLADATSSSVIAFSAGNIAAKGAYDALKQISATNRDAITSNDELRASYVSVTQGMQSAMDVATEPTEALVASSERLVAQLQAASINTAPFVAQLNALGKATMGADYAFEGGSLTPALRRYIEAALASNATTGQLTGSMVTSMQSVLAADDAFLQLDATMRQNQTAITNIDTAISNLRTKMTSAGKEEKAEIQSTIVEYQNKKREIQNENRALEEKQSLIERSSGVEIEKIKEAKAAYEDAEKAKAKAVEELQKNTERTAELRQKQLEAEQKAENELYADRQKQAAESLKWVEQLDDSAKKRLMSEGKAVEILSKQGVVLTDLQKQELTRLQNEYKTEAAMIAQSEALQKQLDPMGALVDGANKIGDAIGSLSSGIGDIGDIFGFDTSGIEGLLGKAQGLLDLPGKLTGAWDKVKGIGSTLSSLGGSLGGLGSTVSGLLGSIGGGVSGLVGSLGGALSGAASGIGSMLGSLGGLAGAAGPAGLAIAGIAAAAWGLSKAFEDTKSKGTEAAEGFQDFVGKNISGGAELEAALKTNFDAMGKAGFDFQTFLQQTGTTMDQTFGGISANWQEGSTAMDIFTQSIMASGVEMSKAPQVALQMMASFQDMGLSAEEAGAKMLEIAAASGMSTAEIEKLKTALQSGGEEGEVTGSVFDANADSVDALTGKVTELGGSLDGVTGKLSGTGDEGAATGSIFDANSRSVDGLTGKIEGLSGSLDGVTGKLGGAGSEGIETSNVFSLTQSSASSLKSDVDSLSVGLGGVQSQFSGAKGQAESFAASLSQVAVQAANVSSIKVPGMASGGFPRGLAMVNERGNEIADIPGIGMMLMQSRGAVLGAFPAGTEIIPHAESMQIIRENPSIPRMATGGIVTKNLTKTAQPIVNNYYQYTVNLNASVIDRNTARMIDAELQKLAKQRAGA